MAIYSELKQMSNMWGTKLLSMPLDVPVECTFEQLSDMIYSRTTMDKKWFKLVLNCKYPLKSGNRFQHFPIWDDSSVYRMLSMTLDVPVECTFEQLSDMIYSRTTIDKQWFKLVLNCKYPLKGGNRFQHFPIWDDSSVYRMLNMVNTTSIEEIELYIEVVQVKP